MLPIKNYILLVDSHKPRRRSFSGRYRVGAKSKKEAIVILREKIKFGSIHVYYECRSDDENNVNYKTVIKEC